MTAETKIQAGPPAQACHEMLLRLAGTAPDDLVTGCRGWLAEGKLETLALAIVFYATSANATLASDDLALLAELLEYGDVDRSGLHQIETDDFDPFPRYRFARRSYSEPGTGSGRGGIGHSRGRRIRSRRGVARLAAAGQWLGVAST